MKRRERCQMTFFFFSLLRQEADSSQFTAGSEVHLTSAQKLKPNKPRSSFLFFLLCGRCKTPQTREAKLRHELNSRVKLQKRDDINITRGLAAPKYMQGDSRGGAHNPSVSLSLPPPHPSLPLCQPCHFADKCLGPLIGCLLYVESW